MKILFRSDQKRGQNLPNLGIGYLIAYLDKYHPGLTMDVSFDREDILEKIDSFKPDLIGFTAVTFTYKKASELAKTVKERYPSIPLVMGGAHITLCWEALPDWIDVAVLSEGEQTFTELVKSYQDSGRLKKEDIPGIVFRKNGNLVNTGPRELLNPLDSIPHPDLDALSVPKKELSHIITSRGCPYRCKFCCSAKIWKNPRYHSAEYVVEEIEKAVRHYGRKKLMIYDDLFTVNKSRIRRMAQLMEEKGLNKSIEFDSISHVDFLNEEVVTDLKKMGVTRISLGMESGSKKVLDYLKNGVVTHDKIRQAVKLCKEHGIKPMGSFMIGSPHETEEDIKQTMDFIKEIGLDELVLNVTTPFPGTELWEYAREKGFVKDNEWDERLWGMQHVDEGNIGEKIILADVDKETFLRLYRRMDNLLLSIVRRKELRNWLRRPYNLKLLWRHIRGRIKTFKKRIRVKLKMRAARQAHENK
jgi:radical SAM superfamily enzyme YgiQ (UPF0313 family)